MLPVLRENPFGYADCGDRTFIALHGSLHVGLRELSHATIGVVDLLQFLNKGDLGDAFAGLDDPGAPVALRGPNANAEPLGYFGPVQTLVAEKKDFLAPVWDTELLCGDLRERSLFDEFGLVAIVVHRSA